MQLLGVGVIAIFLQIQRITKISKKRYTPDELRIKVMEHLVKHKIKYKRILGHLPLSWGGRLRSGGGWSGAWLELLNIITEAV